MTPQQLSASTGAPLVRAQAWLKPIEDAMAAHEINTPQRQAAFLAQIGHESDHLLYTAEIWGPTAAQARYGSRADLGNTRPEAIKKSGGNPGRFYKGRGLIQITGYDNYLRCGNALGLELDVNPALLEQKPYAALSAAWFWHSHGLNELADAGEFVKITEIINGGHNGLASREALYVAAKQAMEVAA